MTDAAFRQLAARLHRHGARCTGEFLLHFSAAHLCRTGIEAELQHWADRLDQLEACGAVDAAEARRQVRSPLYLICERPDA